MKSLKIILSLTLLAICYNNANAQAFSGGSGTSADPYLISTIADIDTLAARVASTNNWSLGKYFSLINDIGTTGSGIVTRIGTNSSNRAFRGIFNGNGYTIKVNYTTFGTYSSVALFRYSISAKIYNLTVSGSISISGSPTSGIGFVAGIVGMNFASTSTDLTEIDNCKNKANIYYGGNDGIVGGIVAQSERIIITNCSNTGNITTAGIDIHCGGIIGIPYPSSYSDDTIFVSNCYNDSCSLSCTTSVSTADIHIGGIVGCVNGVIVIVDSCYNGGTITSTTRTSIGTSNCIFGGIMALNVGNAILKHCYNKLSMQIYATNYATIYIGGIIGNNSINSSTATDNIYVENCHNYGDEIIATGAQYSYTGGIVGYNYGDAVIKHCSNECYIWASGHQIKSGGIVGDNDNSFGSLEIDTCYNKGVIYGINDITGGYGLAHMGGILGDNAGAFYITGCKNKGTIIATGNSNHYDLGGIVGDNMGTGTILRCTNIGDIATPNTSSSSTLTLGGIIGYGNGASTAHCHNAGLVKGGTNTGGIVGSIAYLANINNCLNNGSILLNNSNTTNKGGIVGQRTGGSVTGNFYDKQMCVYGGINNTDATNQAVGKFTDELIGTGIQTNLGTTNWIYTTNLYPMLYNDSICKVAASPVYLYHISGTVFDRHNEVSHNFMVSNANGVYWTSDNSSIVSITGTSATITGVGSIPYIYPNLETFKRSVPLTTMVPNYFLRTCPDTASHGTTTPDSVNIVVGNNYIITATPAHCYDFISWEDSLGNTISTKIIDTITVLGDTLLIATFQLSQKTLTLRKNPYDGGNVLGGGTKLCGTLDTIRATTNPCYRFINWSDSATGTVISNSPEHPIVVDYNRTLIANFEIFDTFIVKTKAQPTSWGVATGDDTVHCTNPYIIITATPNDCYIFKQWVDSATETTISTQQVDTLTAYVDFNTNITLLAIFEIDSILISTSADPIVTGTTIVNKIASSVRVGCNDDAIISAEPINDCYRFVNWTDAETGAVVSTKKTDTLNFTKNVSLIANFVLDTFNLTLTANPTDYGNVKGTGKVLCGNEVVIEAIPNNCKLFVNWTDAETGAVVSYKRIDTIILYENKHFIANFTTDTFNLILSSRPNNSGILTGQGIYECGKNAKITATSKKDCYTFSYWENQNTGEKKYDSVINVEMVANLHYVAHFSATDTFNLFLQSAQENNIILSGAGLYSTCDPVAPIDVNIFDICINFICWTNTNGDTISNVMNTEIILHSDSVLIAHFSMDFFALSLTPNPANAGIVNDVARFEDTLQCHSMFIFSAKANLGWKFVNWTDSLTGKVISTKSTDSLHISNTTKLVANFEEGYDTITITLIPNPSIGGILKGGGKYAIGTKAQLQATPNTGYNFVSWTENGNVLNKNASFAITASRNISIIGNFRDASSDAYIVSLRANIDNAGTLTGYGAYSPNANVEINAIANDGFYFKHWATEDNIIISTTADYTFKISSDTDLVAYFAADNYVISLSAMPTYMGKIESGISGLYYKGHTFNLQAVPSDTSLYRFVCWTTYQGDVLSKNEKLKLVVASDSNIIANFDIKVGIIEDDINGIYIFPNPVSNTINISIDNTFERNINISLTDILYIEQINIYSGGAEIGTNIYKVDVSDLPSGMYFLRFDLGNKIIVKKIIIHY
jgi:hypothetical protein